MHLAAADEIGVPAGSPVLKIVSPAAKRRSSTCRASTWRSSASSNANSGTSSKTSMSTMVRPPALFMPPLSRRLQPDRGTTSRPVERPEQPIEERDREVEIVAPHEPRVVMDAVMVSHRPNEREAGKRVAGGQVGE